MFGCFQYSVATDSKSFIHLKRGHFSRYTHCTRFNIYYFCSAYVCLCHQINKYEMDGACGMSGKEEKLHTGFCC